MGKENGFVPIGEANTDRVRFAIDLPAYVDRTQIRANTPRIERLMRIGGISHLRVETSEAKDRPDSTDSDSVAITGFDSQGEAYAARPRAQTKTDGYAFGRSSDENSGSPTASLSVKLDIDQINKSIAQDGVRSTSAWANQIDKGISEGLRSAGTRVLLIENLNYEGILVAQQGFNFAIGFSLGTHHELISALVIGTPSILNLIIKAMPESDRRASFFFGPQLDRAALLQVRSRIQRVVKSTEENR